MMKFAFLPIAASLLLLSGVALAAEKTSDGLRGSGSKEQQDERDLQSFTPGTFGYALPCFSFIRFVL